jgi:hypothetical protein
MAGHLCTHLVAVIAHETLKGTPQTIIPLDGPSFQELLIDKL